MAAADPEQSRWCAFDKWCLITAMNERESYLPEEGKQPGDEAKAAGRIVK